MKQISNSDAEEYIPAAFTRSLVDVPGVTESEMRRRRQLEANAGAGTVSRAAKHSITRADPRHVEHKHRTDRVDVYIIEERVQSAARESHIVFGFLLGFFRIDLIKLRR